MKRYGNVSFSIFRNFNVDFVSKVFRKIFNPFFFVFWGFLFFWDFNRFITLIRFNQRLCVSNREFVAYYFLVNIKLCVLVLYVYYFSTLSYVIKTISHICLNYM